MLQAKAPTGDNRCLTQTRGGQCRSKATLGSDYCADHGAHRNLKRLEKKEIYDFQRSQFLALSDENKEVYNNNKYNLSAELGVCRMMLQKYFDMVKNFDDIQTYDHKITSLIDRIAKISEAVLKADQKLGTLMSEEDAFSIAQGLLDAVHSILDEHIEDPQDFAGAMEKVNAKFVKVLDAS